MASWLVLACVCLGADNTTADVLTQIGRDGLQTRLYSVDLADLEGTGSPSIVVGGFTNLNGSDTSDIQVYEMRDGKMELQWRVMWRGASHSVLRTLRAGDLDGDGRDEVVILGRAGDRRNHRYPDLEDHASAQLKVFGVRQGVFSAVDEATWNNGTYTHGYGLALADLDGDGQPEIVNGGFYDQGDTEQAELRVWKLRDGKLELVTSTHWGDKGKTRINGIAAGDVDGDGRVEIVTAGRTGQIKISEEVTAEERGQLTAWRLDQGTLVRVASWEWEDQGFARLRELKLADLDGDGSSEIIAVGRVEAQGRPYLGVYELKGDRFARKIEPELPHDSVGEIRDVVFYGTGQDLRVVTIGARGAKPDRQAEMQVWKMGGGKLELVQSRVSINGDETRVRDLVLLPAGESKQLVTVGFIRRRNQLLGQILNWGAAP